MRPPAFPRRTERDDAAPPFGPGDDPDRWQIRSRVSRRWVATEVVLALILVALGVASAVMARPTTSKNSLPGWIGAPVGVVAGAVVAVAAFLRREVVIDRSDRSVQSTLSLGRYRLWSLTRSIEGIQGVDVITQEAHERRARGGGGRVFVPPQSWIVLRHASGDVSLKHHRIYASRTGARRAAKPLMEHFGFAQLFEDPDLEPPARGAD